jgi:glycosyltransferase involved in cell wall biosynthesis
MKKVIIDPRSNYSYGSFYVYGLEVLVGKRHISYNLSPFAELKDLGNDLRFIIIEGNIKTKYFIHANDSYKLSEENYNWCDVYGCVNANYTHYPKERYPKLVSLVPSFGIRLDQSICKVLFDAGIQLTSNWSYVLNRKEWNKILKKEECNKIQNLKHYFGRRYKAWKNRLPLSYYENIDNSKDNYIFFLSTLWYSDEWNKNDEGVNLRRAHFIRACKKILGDNFEGGLLGDAYSSNSIFEDVFVTQRETFASWIKKTKESTLVFNTPAFWDCHGWKLGEYLAMGKCIISTKLSNDLPYPLEHGVNIHFVENTEESMAEAIEYILSHQEYRHKLELGAKEYWSKYGTPISSLKLLGIE